MKTSYKISIIMPVFSNINLVKASINSVINQTYSDWELLIIDDHSPEILSEKLKKEYSNARIKIHRLNLNKGPGGARNRGLELSSGKYIAFLDSDDVWLPEKLEKQIKFMQIDNKHFSCSHYQTIKHNGEKTNCVRCSPNKISYFSLLKSNTIGCLTAIVERKIISENNITFPENIKHEDYVFWLKILKIVGTCYGLQEILAHYRISKNSVSSNKFKVALYQWHIYRSIENINFIKSFFYFSHYLIKGILKRI